MPITLFSTPEPIVPAFNEALIIATTDVVANVLYDRVVTGVINDGGNAGLQMDETDVRLGDTLEFNHGAYSGTNWFVINVASGVVTINARFLGNQTGDAQIYVSKYTAKLVSSPQVKTLEDSPFNIDFELDVQTMLQEDLRVSPHTLTIVGVQPHPTLLSELTFDCFESYNRGSNNNITYEKVRVQDLVFYGIQVTGIFGIDTDYMNDHLILTSGSANRKFLTNRPLSARVKQGEQVPLYWLNDNTNAFKLQVGANVYDIEPNGETTYMINSFLLQWQPTNLSVVVLDENETEDRSNTKVFVMDDVDVCNGVQLDFINRLGGYDSWMFHKASETATTETQRGDFSGRRLTDYKKTQSTVIVASDLVDEETNAWLSDLLTTSIDVSIRDGLQLIPVVINSNSVPVFRAGLSYYQITVEISVSTQKRSQVR